MFFDPDQIEAMTLTFAEIQADLFATLPKEMVALYRNQRYFTIEATGDTIKRWVYVTATSEVAAHPRQKVYLPPGCIVTGGGARVNWSGVGSLLTGSYPLLGPIHGWAAEGKDHGWTECASLTVWAIGLQVAGINLGFFCPPTDQPRGDAQDNPAPTA